MDDKEILELLKSNPEFLEGLKKSSNNKVVDNSVGVRPAENIITTANNEKKQKTGVIVFLIISIIFMIGCLFVSTTLNKSAGSQFAELEKKLTDNKNEIDKKKLAIDAAKKDAISSVSGLDSKRSIEDQKKVEEMLSKMFNFSSSAEYAKNREEFIEKYKPSEEFLKNFYSDVKAFEHAGEDGKPVNDIDLKTYKSSFVKIKPIVIEVSNDKYSYFGEFKINFSMADEKIANPDTTMAIMYSVDKDGKFSDIKIWGLPNVKGVLIDEKNN